MELSGVTVERGGPETRGGGRSCPLSPLPVVCLLTNQSMLHVHAVSFPFYVPYPREFLGNALHRGAPELKNSIHQALISWRRYLSIADANVHTGK